MVPPALRLREVLDDLDGTSIAVGDGLGGPYLVVTVAGRCGPCWVCAPVSDKGLSCVRTGRTSPWTVIHHSTTGTVDIYRTVLDGSVRESVVLCSRLPEGRSLLAAA